MSSHYSENMSERTSPTDALELLSWHLNYHRGETLSLNQVAEATGLAWATVHKYLETIQEIQNVAPRVLMDADGVHIGSRTPGMEELFSQGASALAAYFLVHAQSEGNATHPIDWSDHARTLKKYTPLLEKMESLGWIERQEDLIRLTPTGVRIAGPAYLDTKSTPPLEDQLRRYRSHGEIRAVLEEVLPETLTLREEFLPVGSAPRRGEPSHDFEKSTWAFRPGPSRSMRDEWENGEEHAPSMSSSECEGQCQPVKSAAAT